MPRDSRKATPLAALVAAVAAIAAVPAANAIEIQFNYDFDTGFFTNNPVRRDLLESAASVYERRLTDSLSAITSGNGNLFTAQPRRPDTGNTVNIPGLDIPADTIVVYAGSRQLGSALGVGGPAGYRARGFRDFFESLETRGQEGQFSGPTANEFSTWGGTMAFDEDADWYFDDDVSNFEDIGRQNDFYSVVLHELAHVFGYGTSDSWDASIDENGRISGPAVQALVPGGVPVSPDGGHFDFGIESINTDGDVQEVLLDPNITTGTRKLPTALDFAALSDIGWEVRAVPLPPAGLLLLGAIGVLAAKRRKR